MGVDGFVSRCISVFAGGWNFVRGVRELIHQHFFDAFHILSYFLRCFFQRWAYLFFWEIRLIEFGDVCLCQIILVSG